MTLNHCGNRQELHFHSNKYQKLDAKTSRYLFKVFMFHRSLDLSTGRQKRQKTAQLNWLCFICEVLRQLQKRWHHPWRYRGLWLFRAPITLIHHMYLQSISVVTSQSSLSNVRRMISDQSFELMLIKWKCFMILESVKFPKWCTI